MNAFGQIQTIGVQGGLSLANIISPDIYKYHNGNKVDSRVGFSGGLDYEFHFSKRYFVGLDIHYDQFGNKEPWFPIDVDGKPVSGEHWLRSNYDYLSLPVKIGYTKGEKLKGFAMFGVCPSFLLHTQIIVPQYDNDDNFLGDKEFPALDNTQRFDFRGLIEAGIGYSMFDRIDLFTAIKYRHSLIQIKYNKNLENSSTIQHSGFSFSLGIKYSLKTN